MKRTNKTAIALATAGALGFGIVPMADAQTREAHTTVPASPNDLQEIPTGTATETETFVQGNGAGAPSAPATVERVTEENGTTVTSTLRAGEGETRPHDEVITTEENGKKKVLFEDKNGVQFYLDVNEKGEPVRNGEVVQGLRPATNPKKPGETTEKDALPVVLGVLGGLAGLGLVIAGVNYWVNKDGSLVTDPNKVNEPSKPEDAANTEKIVGENVNEVASQLGIDPATGQPVDGGERGIGASTGVNKIPVALLSLLLASVLGAAAFVFGRRQLV